MAYECSNRSNIVKAYSLLEPDVCAASNGNGEMETMVNGEIKQDRIFPINVKPPPTQNHSYTLMPGDQDDHVSVLRALVLSRGDPIQTRSGSESCVYSWYTGLHGSEHM
jgi:hypothetical protein